MHEAKNIELSIVTPVHNEAESLTAFYRELRPILEEMQIEFEVCFVDDGSNDTSWATILQIIKDWPRDSIIGIKLAQNYGQMIALEAGLSNAHGSYLLTMDSDLQHPPSLIPTFWHYREEFDVVQGRQSTRKDGFFKSRLSKSFYRFLEGISGIKIAQNVGDFRLMNRTTANFLLSSKENPKIFRFMISKYHINSKSIEFTAEERKFGESKYRFTKLVKFGMVSIVKTTTRPLYLSAYLSVFFLVTFLIEFIFVLFSAIEGQGVPGWASLAGILSVALAGIFGILGIFGIYLAQLIDVNQKNNNFRISTVVKTEDF